MVLAVELEDFASVVKKLTDSNEVFLAIGLNGCVVTVGVPEKQLLIRAETPQPFDQTKDSLRSAGLDVMTGVWTDRVEEPTPSVWVASVAYRSSESKPGLWCDAFAVKPTAGQVLTRMYEEFRELGDIGDLPLDDFIRQIDPNVLILSPDELLTFAARSAEST